MMVEFIKGILNKGKKMDMEFMSQKNLDMKESGNLIKEMVKENSF